MQEGKLACQGDTLGWTPCRVGTCIEVAYANVMKVPEMINEIS